MRKRAANERLSNSCAPVKRGPRPAAGVISQNGSSAMEQVAAPTAARSASSGVSLNEKIKQLLKLAKEQGHLTYDDLNEVLGEGVTTPEELDIVQGWGDDVSSLTTLVRW